MFPLISPLLSQHSEGEIWEAVLYFESNSTYSVKQLCLCVTVDGNTHFTVLVLYSGVPVLLFIIFLRSNSL